MRIAIALLFALALSLSTDAFAHSPFQREHARLTLDDGRTLSIRSHWGDGIIAADPVMAVAVIDDGTRYGVPVAIGPVSERGRIAARCPALDRCFVDYFGMGVGPDRTFRLNSAAPSTAVPPPADWEWCVDHGDCDERGFERVPSPAVSLEAFSPNAILSSVFKLAPLLLAIVLLGAASRKRAGRGKVLGWMAIVLAGMLMLLSVIWIPLTYITGSVTPLIIDAGFFIASIVVAVALSDRPPRETEVS